MSKRPEREKLCRLFAVMFRIGCIGFGGGNALIPVIQNYIVEKQGLISQEQYDEDVEIYYTNSELLGEFQPTKKYVCVVPVYNSGMEFSEYYWVETSEEYVFESERDSSHTKYEIKILPKEDNIGN